MSQAAIISAKQRQRWLLQCLYYRRAKRRLSKILRGLQLRLSQHTTRMGRVKPGFHFLGVQYEVPRGPQPGQTQVTATLHRQSSQRARGRVRAMRDDAVHPVTIQRYLVRWATWWHAVVGLGKERLIQLWVLTTEQEDPSAVWLGRDLLLGGNRYLKPPSGGHCVTWLIEGNTGY